MLPLPPQLRAKRDELIARVSVDLERSATALVLAVTSDATYDRRLLTAGERDYVAALLALPLPSERDLIQTKRNVLSVRPTEPMLSGRPEAVIRAIRILEDLPQNIVDAMAEFTSRTPERVAGVLRSTFSSICRLIRVHTAISFLK